jgi:hypothetical protein
MFAEPENAALRHYVVKFGSKLLVSETDTNKNGWKLTTSQPHLALQSFDIPIENPRF